MAGLTKAYPDRFLETLARFVLADMRHYGARCAGLKPRPEDQATLDTYRKPAAVRRPARRQRRKR